MKSGCIIAIGDELLNGFTLDTNSQWIKEQSLKYDLEIIKSVIIPDDKEKITNELLNSLASNVDMIFISGGLGPTHDDLTKESLSSILDLPLIVDLSYKNRLIEKIKTKYESSGNQKYNIKSPRIDEMLDSQSLILENFKPIDNEIGTALGMVGSIEKTKIFILPGVPKELKSMFCNTILKNYLNQRPFIVAYTLKTIGITESKLYSKLKPVIEENTDKFKFSFLPHFWGVNLRLSKIDKKQDLDKIVQIIKDKLGLYLYGENEETLESTVSDILIKNNISISIAESCTGGLVLKKLTDLPGSSSYLKGGLVAYSNEIKEEVLGVSSETISSYGAVSSETALEMSNNISKQFKTDFGVSVTGISGPGGGTSNKPIGLYYVGIKFKDIHIVKKFLFNVNDRMIHREVVSSSALNLIRLALERSL